MKKTKNRQTGFNVGTSLILVSFVLLCLVAFAALSYSSAFSDFKLTSQTAKHKEQYYEACNLAEEKIDQIDQVLLDTYKESNTAEEYQKGIQAFFESEKDLSLTDTSDGSCVAFSIHVNEKQTLFVRLLLLNPMTEELDPAFYEIMDYRIMNQPTSNTENTTIYENGGLLF